MDFADKVRPLGFASKPQLRAQKNIFHDVSSIKNDDVFSNKVRIQKFNIIQRHTLNYATPLQILFYDPTLSWWNINISDVCSAHIKASGAAIFNMRTAQHAILHLGTLENG